MDGVSGETLLRWTRCSWQSAHTPADDVRMSSLEVLLPEDLKKRVQLNHARLTSCVFDHLDDNAVGAVALRLAVAARLGGRLSFVLSVTALQENRCRSIMSWSACHGRAQKAVMSVGGCFGHRMSQDRASPCRDAS